MTTEIRDMLTIIALTLSIGGSIYAWLTRGSKEAAKKLEKLEGSHTIVEKRVDRLEDAMLHLPDKEIVHRLEMALSELKGQIGRMDERMEGQLGRMDERLKPLSAIADRWQDFIAETHK